MAPAISPSSPMAAGGLIEQRRSSPGLLLALLGHVAMRRLRDAHTQLGLTPRQFHLLALLQERGPLAQSELGQMMGIDPSILVTMLNPLEADGLVARERDPDDRRRHFVTITGAGERHLARAAEAQREAENSLLAGLAAEQREQLRTLLLELQTTLGLEPSCSATAAEACPGAEGETDGC